VRAVIATDRTAGAAGLRLAEVPHPHAAENDVIVRVHAAGFTPGELDWPATWTDRAGHDRTTPIPGHEMSGVVVELGFGTTGLTVGQRVFGLTDWARDGTLAEFVAVEARNLAPLSPSVDDTVAAAVPISALTAWQGLFEHGRLTVGQRVLIHGAAGAVGCAAVQLAREAGAWVIGTGRARHRGAVLDAGADEFVELHPDSLDDVDGIDVVFDVIGGEVLDRSAAVLRPGGVLVTIAEPPRVLPAGGAAVFFVVEPDRAGLVAVEQRLRDGRLRPALGNVCELADAPAAFAERSAGKTVVRVAPDSARHSTARTSR
jgi:NADPH:quinone reductase-like Zn-dependent oxidoreductase